MKTFQSSRTRVIVTKVSGVRHLARHDEARVEITPEVLLKAYSVRHLSRWRKARTILRCSGSSPNSAACIPLDGSFRVPRRLARTIRSNRFEVHVDRDFDAVIDACAAPAAGRDSTWINKRIRRLYRALFDRRQCHTVEAWRDGTPRRRALWRQDRRRVFRREHVSLRARCFEGGARASGRAAQARRLQIARRAIHDRASGELRRDRNVTAGISEACLTEAVAADAQFYCWPSDGVIDGGVVLQSVNQIS